MSSDEGALEGRVAVVTGGASGLGAAISHRLASAGADVVVADLDAGAAGEVAEAIRGAGAQATAFGVDVRHDDQVEAMADAAAARGPIAVLVLSAAVETRASLLDTTDQDWATVIDTNLKGPFLCMRHVVPHMVDAGGGSVIALGSTLGQIVAPKYPAYCASKFALTNLCKQVAIEHAADGVRVNVVAPSACDTGLFMRMAEESGDPDSITRMVTSNVPSGRLGTAGEVCDTVMWLATSATYTSGAVIPLDGGLAARRA